jgi:hypothetical protein
VGSSRFSTRGAFSFESKYDSRSPAFVLLTRIAPRRRRVKGGARSCPSLLFRTGSWVLSAGERDRRGQPVGVAGGAVENQRSDRLEDVERDVREREGGVHARPAVVVTTGLRSRHRRRCRQGGGVGRERQVSVLDLIARDRRRLRDRPTSTLFWPGGSFLPLGFWHW